MLVWILSDWDTKKSLSFRALLGRFLSQYPDIKADFAVKTRKNLWDSLFAHLRDPKGNPVADVIEIPQNWSGLFSKLGLLCETASVYDNFSLSRYPGFISHPLRRGDSGPDYSVPWYMEVQMLYYKPQAAKRALVNVDNLHSSWDGFLSALGALSEGARAKRRYPLAWHGFTGAFSTSDVLARVWNRGGGLFSEDFNRCTLTKEETVSGIDDMLSLALRQRMGVFDQWIFDEGQKFEDFSDFILSSRTSFAGKSHFRVAPAPGTSLDGSLIISSSLAAASGGRYIKEAGLFLEWVSRHENAAAFSDGFGVYPCLKSAYDEKIERMKEGELAAKIFSASKPKPDMSVYPTAEILLDRVLWNMSVKISRQAYSREELQRELIIAQGEIDYLLSLY